jgi:hypothetical protein
MVLNGLTTRPSELLGKILLLRIGGRDGLDVMINCPDLSCLTDEPTIFADQANGPMLRMKSFCSFKFLSSYLLRFYETTQNIMHKAMCSLLFHCYRTS